MQWAAALGLSLLGAIGLTFLVMIGVMVGVQRRVRARRAAQMRAMQEELALEMSQFLVAAEATERFVEGARRRREMTGGRARGS